MIRFLISIQALLCLMAFGILAGISARAEQPAAVVDAPAAVEAAATAVSCQCEELACGPCEKEDGLEFYSAKCGPEGVRVKSCKRPKCSAVENQRKCLADRKLPQKSRGQAEAEGDDRKAQREPAAVQAPLPLAGTIDKLTGTVFVIHPEGSVSELAHVNQVLHQGERIETKEDGMVKVRLRDQSLMTVAPNTVITMTQVHVDENSGVRNVTLDLLRGKVRNRVQKKYDGSNSYLVKTRAAVAGVRGTDFVTRFEPGDKEWISEVQTLEGLVHLEKASVRTDEIGAGPKQSVEVAAGTSSAFVIGAPIGGTKNEPDALGAAIENGSFTSVRKLNEEEANSIRDAMEFPKAAELGQKKAAAKADVASESSDSVCHEPNGGFNQCSFSCEGNPNGEKVCRMDLPGVTCVRRICRASGAWVEATRLPASEAVQCASPATIVHECGAYW